MKRMCNLQVLLLKCPKTFGHDCRLSFSGCASLDGSPLILLNMLLFSGLPPNKVVPRLKQKVLSFKQGMPVITSLRNPALRTRHWEAIQNVIGTRIVRDKYFTLGHLLQLKVTVFTQREYYMFVSKLADDILAKCIVIKKKTIGKAKEELSYNFVIFIFINCCVW